MVLRTIEKYEILEEIGHGGMATVFRARDTRLDRAVALKVMHPHLRGSKEARARFRREAQGVAKLRHSRILEIYDYSGEDSEESYIATELLTGPTLRKFADENAPIPAEIAACFGIEVCRALSAAHAKGIVHRDVKPENILIHHDRESDTRCVKLTDFGIADMVDSHSMTATGQILGSPGHMSPEQIEGKDTDGRSDVFSLGTVLYLLACGRLPFTGKNPHQVLKRIVDGEYADPLRVQPGIGGAFRAILTRALAHEPGDRFASAADLEKELTAFVARAGITDPADLVARYLADPSAVTKEVQAATIPAYVAIGKKARDAGDVPAALDAFNRVLALDGDNAEVLALVESVGRQKRTRSAAGWIAAAAVAAMLIGGTWMTLTIPPGGPPERPIEPIAAEPEDAGSPVTAVETDAGADAAVVTVAAAPDAGLQIVGPTRIRRPDIPVVATRGPPRYVSFDPDPESVEISVDGSAFQAFGSNFSGLQLDTGVPHTFVVRPSGVVCCSELRVTRVIEPQTAGEPDRYTLSLRLPSVPASLFVRAGLVGEVGHVQGTVVVRNGRVRAEGRLNEIITVPLESERRGTFTYTVTGDEGGEYTGQVELVAGELAEPRVTLERTGGTPPE